jgi:hypothetical protein
LATPRTTRDRGAGRPRVGFHKGFNQLIFIEVNGAEAIGHSPQGDANIAMKQAGQIFRRHVIKRQVFPLAFVTLDADWPFQEYTGRKDILECW